jgi:hypothetical protein
MKKEKVVRLLKSNGFISKSESLMEKVSGTKFYQIEFKEEVCSLFIFDSAANKVINTVFKMEV